MTKNKRKRLERKRIAKLNNNPWMYHPSHNNNWHASLEAAVNAYVAAHPITTDV